MAAYDQTSKLLFERTVAALLGVVGNYGKVVSWRFLPSDVVTQSRLPDFVVELSLDDGRRTFVLIEFATYPGGEAGREPDQMIRGLMLLHLKHRQLPEGLVVVLTPKGALEVPTASRLESPLGTTQAALQWQVVRLWDLPAERFLSPDDPSLTPWAVLARHDGTPEELLARCEANLASAPAETQAEIRAALKVFGSLRFGREWMDRILGDRSMLNLMDFPAIRYEVEQAVDRAKAETSAKAEARGLRRALLRQLKLRFGAVPTDLTATLEVIADHARLEELADQATLCQTLQDFRAACS